MEPNSLSKLGVSGKRLGGLRKVLGKGLGKGLGKDAGKGRGVSLGNGPGESRGEEEGKNNGPGAMLSQCYRNVIAIMLSQ